MAPRDNTSSLAYLARLGTTPLTIRGLLDGLIETGVRNDTMLTRVFTPIYSPELHALGLFGQFLSALLEHGCDWNYQKLFCEPTWPV